MGLGVAGPFGTTGTHQFDWCHVSRIGVRDMLSCQLLAAVLPPTAPLDSGLRRNDDWGAGMTSAGAGSTGVTYPGSESGTCFRAKTGGGFASPHPSGFRPSPE